jgi:hypothetical protein
MVAGRVGDANGPRPAASIARWRVASSFEIITDMPRLRILLLVFCLALAALSVSPPAQASAAVWRPTRFTAVRAATMSGMSAVSSTEVWAVGWRRSAAGQDVAAIAHRTTTGWHSVPAVQPGSGSGDLCCSIFKSVAAVSPTDVWAVGYFHERSPPCTHRALRRLRLDTERSAARREQGRPTLRRERGLADRHLGRWVRLRR